MSTWCAPCGQHEQIRSAERKHIAKASAAEAMTDTRLRDLLADAIRAYYDWAKTPALTREMATGFLATDAGRKLAAVVEAAYGLQISATHGDVGGRALLLTPEMRSLRAKLAAHSLHAKGGTSTEAGTRAFLASFEKQVDPTGELPPDVRAKRAAHARKAHFQRLALASARARAHPAD